MSSILTRFFIIPLSVLFLMNTAISAQPELKSMGIGIRGSFYNPAKHTSSVRISNHIGYSVNTTASGGGCLYVFSRISEATLFEFNIGNIASVGQKISSNASQKVSVFNMTPILFGLRYDFLQSHYFSGFQPYLSGGFGVYLFSDVMVAQGILHNEVEVSTIARPGLYLGGGLNIRLGSWISLNFDGKYHLVKLNPNYERSGFEFGIGFNFSWGKFDNSLKNK